MALNANALVTLAEAQDFLNAKSAQDQPAVEAAINRASLECERYCDRPFKEATYTNLRLMGPRHWKLYLRAAPVKVAETLTVTVGGTVQTVWKTEADGDPSLKDVILADDDPWTTLGQRNHLYREAGWWSTDSGNPYNVLLTYTGGFATIPDDLKEAALLVVQKLFRDAQRQFADVATVNTPTGSITLFDSAWPRRALALLNQYRLLAI